jgi:hypothetical protein
MPVRRVHPLSCLLVCLSLSIAFPMLFPTRALAESNPIRVQSETQSGAFPNAITFQLTAHDTAGSISQATLLLTSNLPFYIDELHVVKIDHPSATITVTWREDTTGDHFLVPGTPITYTWELTDNNGTYDLPQQQFTTTDTRFPWQHLTHGLLQINWYNRPASFGQAILSQALSSIQHISGNLGGGPEQPLTLWIYQTHDDFRTALTPSTHEWVGGIAFPSLDEAFIVVDSLSDETLIRDMPHELTHLVFHQLISQGIDAPIWFDEGLAVYNQFYQEPEMSLRFKQALAAHALIPLKSLYFYFPADADQAYLAYAESWNLIAYMYQYFGTAKMTKLIRYMNNDDLTFQQDLTLAIGEDSDHLENQWHLSLNQPPTLNIAQPAPASSPEPAATHISTTDSNAPLYMTLGILLVVLPLLGLIFLFSYQRRTLAMRVVAQQPAALLPMLSPTYQQADISWGPTYHHPHEQTNGHIPDTPHSVEYFAEEQEYSGQPSQAHVSQE